MSLSRLLGPVRTQLAAARRIVAIALAAGDRARRRRAVRALLKDGPEPPAAVVQDLRAEGFAGWHLAADVAERLRRAYATLDSGVRPRSPSGSRRSTGKQFFEEVLTIEDLVFDPVFTDVALQPQVLATVAAAMGLVPHLESIEIYRSRPNPGALAASQLWHRDVNDKLTIKQFVYLNDVDDSNGPFTFIPAGDSRRVRRSPHHYMSDAYVDAYLPRDTWRRVKGAAGTAFLIDTRRCLHHGSRCSEPRIAYIATYSSGIKFTAMADAWREILGERARGLGPLQRAVCGIS